MSRQLPALIRRDALRPFEGNSRPEIIVVEQGRMAGRPSPHPLARLAVGLAPDILRAVERAVAQRAAAGTGSTAPTVSPDPWTDPRSRASGFQLSETEYDMRMPFVRKITVRKATAWAADLPAFVPAATAGEQPRGGVLLRAGVLGLGACVVAALGLLASRAGVAGGGRRS